jgi:MFS family permease
MNSAQNQPQVSKGNYIGIFLIALSTLMYEILLTRIFSVTMGYHFAFMAVSLAMFGMTVGAIIVYIFPQKFPQEKINSILTKQALYFSLATLLSFLIHLFIPFIHGMSLFGMAVTAFTYAEISVPFVFSGICVSLLLTRFPKSVNKLYAADLIGASLGCILVVVVLNVSGGPTGVFITALFSAAAAYSFNRNSEIKSSMSKGIVVFSLVILVFSVFHTVLVQKHEPLLRLFWVRGEWAEKPLYEKWNSFSRVSIDGDSTKYETPFGWGLSNKYDRSRKIRQLMLNIDAHSTTVLSHFNGDTSELSHLKYDVSNLAQYLRPQGDIMIIGSGAGRDVLSSLAFGQKNILGIEINKDMISAINDDFGNFTGHLDKYPNVEFVGDEARSYIQRMDTARKFDIIQVSVIDNWSAAASGAFVLTENALYTTETWKLLFSRLKPDGILTVTRFYRAKPIEHYRLMNITADALIESGIKDIRSHVMLIKCQQQERLQDRSGTGTLLISRSPFSSKDLKMVDSLCKTFEFEDIISPQHSADSIFVKLTNENLRGDLNKNFPLDITSPSDDKPFFFHYMNFTDLPNTQMWNMWDMGFNAKAIFILLTLAGTMSVLSFLCIVIPLKITAKKVKLKGTSGFFIFFIAIGLGFMLIEISQIQRLNIFLGHPTYSLAAALFTMLLSSGIGSYFSGADKPNFAAGSKLRFILLMITLVLFGIFTPFIIEAFREQSTEVRILVSVLTLFPMGLFLGMAFPAGMKLAGERSPGITPWLWGINGVMSVLATVLSIIIAMNYGISASYWTGAVCYLAAFAALISFTRKTA